MNYLTLHFFQREVLVEFQEKKHQFVMSKNNIFFIGRENNLARGKSVPLFPLKVRARIHKAT